MGWFDRNRPGNHGIDETPDYATGSRADDAGHAARCSSGRTIGQRNEAVSIAHDVETGRAAQSCLAWPFPIVAEVAGTRQ